MEPIDSVLFIDVFDCAGGESPAAVPAPTAGLTMTSNLSDQKESNQALYEALHNSFIVQGFQTQLQHPVDYVGRRKFFDLPRACKNRRLLIQSPEETATVKSDLD